MLGQEIQNRSLDVNNIFFSNESALAEEVAPAEEPATSEESAAAEESGEAESVAGEREIVDVAGQAAETITDTSVHYQMQTLLSEEENKCLEGQGGAAPGSGAVLDGAGFMDDCQNVTGQLWKLVPTDIAVAAEMQEPTASDVTRTDKSQNNLFYVQYQWDGSDAAWNPGGTWLLGDYLRCKTAVSS